MDEREITEKAVEFSVVVPVYKNESNLSNLFLALSQLSVALEGRLEVVFVVDGSPDRSFEIIAAHREGLPFKSELLSHSRNFGSFAAIVTGLSASTGRFIVTMAADLQEPLSLIMGFFEVLQRGEAEIVVGSRASRQDPLISRVLSKTFWSLYRFLIDRRLPRGGVDVFGCTRKIAAQIERLPESNSSLIGLLYWIGFQKVEILYDRNKRQKGKSAWGAKRKLRYLSDSIFSFTHLPITAILIVGLLGSLVSLALATIVFSSWWRGAIDAPGYTALILVQLGSTASLLLALGVVGTYVWRTYENSKRRPNAIVDFSSVIRKENEQ